MAINTQIFTDTRDAQDQYNKDRMYIGSYSNQTVLQFALEDNAYGYDYTLNGMGVNRVVTWTIENGKIVRSEIVAGVNNRD